MIEIIVNLRWAVHLGASQAATGLEVEQVVALEVLQSALSVLNLDDGAGTCLVVEELVDDLPMSTDNLSLFRCTDVGLP